MSVEQVLERGSDGARPRLAAPEPFDGSGADGRVWVRARVPRVRRRGGVGIRRGAPGSAGPATARARRWRASGPAAARRRAAGAAAGPADAARASRSGSWDSAGHRDRVETIFTEDDAAISASDRRAQEQQAPAPDQRTRPPSTRAAHRTPPGKRLGLTRRRGRAVVRNLGRHRITPSVLITRGLSSAPPLFRAFSFGAFVQTPGRPQAAGVTPRAPRSARE